MDTISTAGSQGRSLPDSNTIRILEPFTSEVNKLLKASVSQNTMNTYNNGLHSFQEFRKEYFQEFSWPPNIDEIVNYLAFLSKKGLSYSTAKYNLSGISFHLQISNHIDLTKFFIVKKMLEGLRPTKPSKDIRSPITFSLLKHIDNDLQVICQNRFEYYLFSSAFALAYFALLRVGELAAPNRFTSDRVITKDDITFCKSGVIIVNIRMSKTDQLGLGTTIEIAPTTESSLLCKSLSNF